MAIDLWFQGTSSWFFLKIGAFDNLIDANINKFSQQNLYS